METKICAVCFKEYSGKSLNLVYSFDKNTISHYKLCSIKCGAIALGQCKKISKIISGEFE